MCILHFALKTEAVIAIRILTPAARLTLRDLDNWLFDRGVNACRATSTHCAFTEFGVDSSSRFSFRGRTHTHRGTQTTFNRRMLKWRNCSVRYLSTLIEVRLRIDAVQHMTSKATHMSHKASPSIQHESFTCTAACQAPQFTTSPPKHCSANLPEGLYNLPMFFFFFCILMVDFLTAVSQNLMDRSSPKLQDW